MSSFGSTQPCSTSALDAACSARVCASTGVLRGSHTADDRLPTLPTAASVMRHVGAASTGARSVSRPFIAKR